MRDPGARQSPRHARRCFADACFGFATLGGGHTPTSARTPRHRTDDAQGNRILALAPSGWSRVARSVEVGREEAKLLRSFDLLTAKPVLYLADVAESDLPEGDDEHVRAWTIRVGARAPGEIHSDFERGFIRAETVAWSDFQRLGSVKAARDQGLMRSEGKEYVVKDGDILLFRFNV